MPKRRQRKLRPRFVELPKHKRGHEVIRLKGMMAHRIADYGGKFDSRLLFNEPEQPDIYHQDFSFYFPGSDKFTIWNAYFITARKAFWDEVHDLAYKRTKAMMSPQEMAANSNMEFVPARRSSTGKVLSYTLKERTMRFEQFGGLTFSEQWRKMESVIAREAPPVIHESFTLDHKYAYGIGTKIVLDVDVVNQASIDAAIDRFIAIGETDWVAANPVPQQRLPTVSFYEALKIATKTNEDA